MDDLASFLEAMRGLPPLACPALVSWSQGGPNRGNYEFINMYQWSPYVIGEIFIEASAPAAWHARLLG